MSFPSPNALSGGIGCAVSECLPWVVGPSCPSLTRCFQGSRQQGAGPQVSSGHRHGSAPPPLLLMVLFSR